MKNEIRYVVIRDEGRYYGGHVWTYDEKRATHFKSKEAAQKIINGHKYWELEIIEKELV